jgi:hypothetical protein
LAGSEVADGFAAPLVRDLAEALDQPLPLLGLENLAELLQVPAGRERVKHEKTAAVAAIFVSRGDWI